MRENNELEKQENQSTRTVLAGKIQERELTTG